ncbi:AAA family ATPase [Gordonia terrae]|uniref:AAA family ATPase n=1 Tax=Gordonia hongkongensis TaxID=1701090 RepID=UPI0022B3B5B8|nr:AAA family ATPase [Gordonia terrae]
MTTTTDAVVDTHAMRMENAVTTVFKAGFEVTPRLVTMLTEAQARGENPMDLAKEIARQRYRDQARTFLDSQEQAARSEAVAARIESGWLDREALDNRPGPQSLLGTLLFRKNLVVLAGEPGSFKSFVALDWAASVAAGKSWKGHTAHRGTVVYLAGEGDVGLPKRLRAWEKSNNRGDKVPMMVYPRPARLQDPDNAETQAMVESVIRRNPDLVVIDTLARYTTGMNENSAEDMGKFVEVASRIKDETGACVVIVHHTARDGGNERGSTALRGASDALYMLKSPNKKKRRVEFHVDRAKEEASGGDPMRLALEIVNLGVDDDGHAVTSLVIPRVDPLTAPAPITAPDGMPTRGSTHLVKLLFNVYVSMADTETGWTQNEVRQVVRESPFNLGANERRAWSKTWGKATMERYLWRPKNADGIETGARWFLDVAKVQKEFGFSDEMEDYYRDVVLAEDPSAYVTEQASEALS